MISEILIVVCCVIGVIVSFCALCNCCRSTTICKWQYLINYIVRMKNYDDALEACACDFPYFVVINKYRANIWWINWHIVRLCYIRDVLVNSTHLIIVPFIFSSKQHVVSIGNNRKYRYRVRTPLIKSLIYRHVHAFRWRIWWWKLFTNQLVANTIMDTELIFILLVIGTFIGLVPLCKCFQFLARQRIFKCK